MKRNLSSLHLRSYWNKLISKFYKTHSKLVNLYSGNHYSNFEAKRLLEKLKSLFRKLSKIQTSVGLKIAGSALALMLATSGLNAQNFVKTGFIDQRLQISGGSAPCFVDFEGNGLEDLYLGSSDGYIFHYERNDKGILVFQDTVKSDGNIIQISSYSSPALVDIDGDGDMDLYLGTSNGSIMLFENTGTAFTAPTTVTASGSPIILSSYTYIEFADINGDGDLDLLSGEGAGYVSLFRNDDSIFTDLGHIQADGVDIKVYQYSTPTMADIDGDGDLDLLVGAYTSNYDGRLYLYTYDSGNFYGQGFLQADSSDIIRGYYPFPTLTDIDNDGDQDLVLGSEYGDLLIFTNDSIGNFTQENFVHELIIGDIFSRQAIGDLDGDGDLDLLVGSYTAGINVFKRDNQYNDLTFAPNSTVSNNNEVFNSPVIADLDNNDILEVYNGTGSGYIQILNNPLLAKTNPKQIKRRGRNISQEEINPPKTLLGYLQDPSNNNLQVSSNAVPTFGDINGDGFLDLFVGTGDGYIEYFLNNGNNKFVDQGRVQADSTDLNTGMNASPTLVDYDFDGDLDLIVGEYFGYLYVYKNSDSLNFNYVGLIGDNGTPITGSQYIYPNFYVNNKGYRTLLAGDTNGISIYHQTPTPTEELLPMIISQCSLDSIVNPIAIASNGDTITGVQILTLPIDSDTTINWTYTDSQNYFTIQEQDVYVVDTIAPEISCLADTTIYLPVGDSILYVNDATFDAVASDNCDLANFENNLNSTETLNGEQFGVGQHTIIWTATDTKGNTDSCISVINIYSTISIEEHANDVRIYPNPSVGIVNINGVRGYNVELIDQNGRILESHFDINSNELRINMLNRKGIFFIKVYNEESVKINKIVIE